MMHCPFCGKVAHTRSSRYLSESTKERYISVRIFSAVARLPHMSPSPG